MTMVIRHERPGRDELVDLYTSVGWSIYAQDPDLLQQAIEASTFVATARDGSDLVGLARCISDNTTIAYLQDVLVRPEQQGGGIGRRLVESCLSRFDHVRQFVLLTDDRPEQLGFYRGLGFSNTRELTNKPLNAFVRIRGASLS